MEIELYACVMKFKKASINHIHFSMKILRSKHIAIHIN